MTQILLKLSLLISILGILILFLISNLIQPEQISNYKELKINQLVKTQGKILDIKNYDEFSIIKLDNNLIITCNCNFKKNQTIQVIGKVVEYKNQLQIQAEKIEILENDN